jgi:diguanylate cyclase (GGDEF)-like protein
MPKTALSERTWRLDQMGSTPDATGSVEDAEAEGHRCKDAMFEFRSAGGAAQTRRPGLAIRLSRSVRDWLTSRLGRHRLDHAEFEDVMHGFAASIDGADDPAVVEAELMRIVRQMAPSSRIELVLEGGSHGDDESENAGGAAEVAFSNGSSPRVLDIPLRCGASVCARLRIRPRTGGPTSYRTEDVRRLMTLGTMAACAMEGLGLFTEWPEENASRGERRKSAPAHVAHADLDRREIALQDATFLNAVLPFALSQARRHREPLSIVCVAVDRLSAIKQLLGKAESDRLVQHVAQTVGGLIRSSDIVARLDDDRIVAVLPRAPRGGAMHVAETICRVVQANSPPGCETPALTVSIGAATFPSCADNVYSLFDAADEALAWAQKKGRSQAKLAPPRPLGADEFGAGAGGPGGADRLPSQDPSQLKTVTTGCEAQVC